MKCEMCCKKEATIHVKQVVDGIVKELFVCEECASEEALTSQSPLSFADFLFGVGAEGPLGDASDNRCCEACGMSLAGFREKNRLGCAECYSAFSDHLNLFMSAAHSGPRHVGKVPSFVAREKDVRSVSAELKRAVAEENFEKAAKLRDKISCLTKGLAAKDKS